MTYSEYLFYKHYILNFIKDNYGSKVKVEVIGGYFTLTVKVGYKSSDGTRYEREDIITNQFVFLRLDFLRFKLDRIMYEFARYVTSQRRNRISKGYDISGIWVDEYTGSVHPNIIEKLNGIK